jgi:hypothetical protein
MQKMMQKLVASHIRDKPGNSKEIPIREMITHTANSAKQGRHTQTFYIHINAATDSKSD